jgi:poly-beta-1,6-N-acetyl-D-glucosamine synthase
MINFLPFLLFIALLFVILYLGYPAIVLIVSKRCGRSVLKNECTPTISLIIPCYNEQKVILRKIYEISRIRYPKDKFEIIVIDSASTDGTIDILKNLQPAPNLRVIFENKRLGKAYAINTALNLAVGEIIILTDADSSFNPDKITDLVDNFSDPTIGAVVGKYSMHGKGLLAAGMSYLFSLLKASLRDIESKIDSASYFTGELIAFRRALVPSFISNTIADDQFILLEVRRQGYRCITEPACEVTENIVESFRDNIKHRCRTTFGTLQVTALYKHMLFNPKYGAFGSFILPMYLIRILFFPIGALLFEISLTIVVIQFLFFSPWDAIFVGVIGILLLVTLILLGRKLYQIFSSVLVLQISVTLGFFDFIKGKRDNAVWEKLK